MNEIEEYLLMIFLESENILDINDLSPLTHGEFYRWEKFKQEELGRTLPEEFEFYLSDAHLKCFKHDEICIAFNKNKNEVQKNKIKITVVNE